MLIYNKLTEIFADFRHFRRGVILLIFNYLYYINSINAARWRHDGGGGLEIIVNKNLRNGGGTRRRPRCKYQAVHITIIICSFAAVQPLGNGIITAAVHRLPKRCIQQHLSILKKACFGRKTACFGGFSAANGTLCNNYINTRKSRYLGLLFGNGQRGCQFRQSLGFPSASYNFLDFQVQEESPSPLC